MKLSNVALAVLLGAASVAASGAENPVAQHQRESLSASLPDAITLPPALQPVTILKPKAGEIISDRLNVQAVVRMDNKVNPKTLRVTLNGTTLTGHATEESCGSVVCRWIMELTPADGLRSGQNRLVAFASGTRGGVDIAQADFAYHYGLQSGQDKPQWLAPSIGLSLNPGGAQPWVTLTTGWPANTQDTLDPTQYSLPYRDTTFPKASDTPCTSRYQVVVLNRLNPMQEDGYLCPSDSTALKSDLNGLTPGAEIVLVGTTLYNNADAGLDTRGIGGTNYGVPPGLFNPPQGYAAIGVSGAAPGSAYESYYLASDLGKPYLKIPFANGLLVEDQFLNYNFHAGGNLQFEVYPNNPNTGNSNVYISENGDVHGWGPPLGSANGFWLLILDRVTLLPIDASTASGSPCQPSGFAQNCGQFFPTGDSDPATASTAANNLAVALGGVTTRQLAVLTTYGLPFQSASVMTSNLAQELFEMGGSPYTFQSLTTSNSTYTLIAPGIFLTDYYNNPFSTGVVNSSSLFSQQGQTGFVRGVMARNNQSLYFPSVVSQEDGLMNASGAKSLSINYDFYTISTQAPIDWPLTDTPGHMAAYHWASYQFLNYHYGETGSLRDDLRAWYFSPSRNSDMAGHNTDFLCPNSVTDSPCAYPGGNVGFTAQDLADVDAELYSELTALHDTDLYLGMPGLDSLMRGPSGLAQQIIAATYQVLNNQAIPVQNTTSVNASSFDWMNLIAGITSIFGAAFGPLDFAEAGAAMGVMSGVVWTGSAEQPWWSMTEPPTPPNYESAFDTTLGQLSASESTYYQNLADSYDSTLNVIYSDWGKLSATGSRTANSDSGWGFSNELDPDKFAAILSAGAQRSVYAQLVPQFYGLDTYQQQPVLTLDNLGMFESFLDPQYNYANSCHASYPSSVVSDGNLYQIFPSFGNPGKTDIYVLGGTIDYQGTEYVTESFPTDSLVNIMFGANSGQLNIPQGLVFGTVAIRQRQGPTMGTYNGIYQCYKPGCQDVTSSSSQSSCIGP
ncbi:MAG: hypothetical protein ABSF46_07275 [Terriglobia bacterium]